MPKKIAAGVALTALLVLVTFSFPVRPGADENQEEIERRLDRGNELALEGDYDGAMAEYHKVLEIDEGNALAHNNLGIIYKRKGLYISAVEEFQAALEALPNYFKAYNNLANVYYERGYYEDAVKYYNKCLAIKPNFADAHWNLALAYEQSGEDTRAVRHFKKFIELSDAPTYVALAQQHIDALSAGPEEVEPAEEMTTYGEDALDVPE
ncbi:MAG: tetratricopeptide repeat protein [Candidatus Coatesbacteria bacterium]|nr:MAG: tetratricopeptide repeat protein [Candidatus Coatesbacteria bacterium]